MAIRLRRRLPTGETRPWTLTEIVQGKPLEHPSHPMFVHFPVAFYIATLALDVLSKLGRFPSAPVATTWLLLGAFGASLVAITTGLVDRATTRRGSKVRKRVNQHMYLQFVTAGLFVVNFAIRWSDRHLAEARPLWLILDVIGVATLVVGQYLGGILVYVVGLRVGESGPATSRVEEPDNP
ncbi:MAG TPA: DUF2231 domain-containing protein [Actinomycetota bacterium]|jgi:uncharacterized membrane protein